MREGEGGRGMVGVGGWEGGLSVRETLWITLRVVTSGFKQPARENRHVCAHKCKRALRLASTQAEGGGGWGCSSGLFNVVGVRDARNLPVGEIWQETAVRETITGAPAHGAHTKSRVMTCDCVCKMEGGGGIGKQERGVLQGEKNGNSKNSTMHSRQQNY